MSKGVFYYIHSHKLQAMVNGFGGRLEKLTAADKLALIIICAHWLRAEDEIDIETAMIRARIPIAAEVHQCVMLLKGIEGETTTIPEVEGLMAALVDQIRDREFLEIN